MSSPISTSERQRRVDELRESDSGYADAVTGLARLTDPNLGDFIPREPVPPPSPDEIRITEKLREADERLRASEQRFQQTITHALRPLEPLDQSDRSPLENFAVRHLSQLWEKGHDREELEFIANELHHDGTIDEVERDVLLDLFHPGQMPAPVGPPPIKFRDEVVQNIVSFAGGDLDRAIEAVEEISDQLRIACWQKVEINKAPDGGESQ